MKATGAPSPFLRWAVTSLLLGLGGIIANLFFLTLASDFNGRWILRHLFDPGAITFTGRGAWQGVLLRIFGIYAPMILIPAGVILLLVYVTTRRSALASRYAEFQSRGWVARRAPLDLRAKVKGAQTDPRAQRRVAFISHPDLPDDDFARIVTDYNRHLATLNAATRDSLASTVVSVGQGKGISAATLSANLPAEITACAFPGRVKSRFAVVIPPTDEATGKKARRLVLPIKR